MIALQISKNPKLKIEAECFKNIVYRTQFYKLHLNNQQIESLDDFGDSLGLGWKQSILIIRHTKFSCGICIADLRGTFQPIKGQIKKVDFSNNKIKGSGRKRTIPTKADDPEGWKQTIFWAKADDLWAKADDLYESRRS